MIFHIFRIKSFFSLHISHSNLSSEAAYTWKIFVALCAVHLFFSTINFGFFKGVFFCLNFAWDKTSKLTRFCWALFCFSFIYLKCEICRWLLNISMALYLCLKNYFYIHYCYRECNWFSALNCNFWKNYLKHESSP